MVLRLCAQMWIQMYFLRSFGRACAPSVAVSWQKAAPAAQDEEIKNELKNSKRKTESTMRELRLQMVLLQARVCGYGILGRERVETVFILWSLSALVLDIITPRVCVWSLNISVLLSSAGTVPYWRKKKGKKRSSIFTSWCFLESCWKDA